MNFRPVPASCRRVVRWPNVPRSTSGRSCGRRCRLPGSRRGPALPPWPTESSSPPDRRGGAPFAPVPSSFLLALKPSGSSSRDRFRSRSLPAETACGPFLPRPSGGRAGVGFDQRFLGTKSSHPLDDCRVFLGDRSRQVLCEAPLSDQRYEPRFRGQWDAFQSAVRRACVSGVRPPLLWAVRPVSPTRSDQESPRWNRAVFKRPAARLRGRLRDVGVDVKRSGS